MSTELNSSDLISNLSSDSASNLDTKGKYYCRICKKYSKQKGHHDTHLNSEAHKNQRKIFELELEKLSKQELVEEYGCDVISKIVQHYENYSEKQFNQITNKDSLRDKIHSIHNYLRNNGGGYGMNALKVFNIIYALKKIEENNLNEKIGLTDEWCKFSYLRDLANTNINLLQEKIIGNNDDNRESVLDSLNDNNKLKSFLFYEIPREINGNVFKYLIEQIDEISSIEYSTNTQLAGKIYEYFIGRDQTAISELGAYFTDRHITEFLYNEEPIVINDNLEVPSMCDPYGGSGGFTVGYILHLQEKYPKINWSRNIFNVYHFDMNEDVIKAAALEFLCLTGEIPDIGNKTSSHIRYANSFADKFNNKKFKKIYTNPPYGGDDNKKTQQQSKRDKVKKYIKNKLIKETNQDIIDRRNNQLKSIENEEKIEKKRKDENKVTLKSSSKRINDFAIKFKLNGNDKEAVSLILLMDLVDIGGTVVGVLKEGVFFNKTYKGLRECLIKNFNVRKVISIPSDQFENTSTKTSALVFDNTEEKTSVVEFSEITVEKFSEDIFEEIEGQIVCTGYSGEGSKLKPDIKNVEKKIVSTATAEEILTNDTISFNGKDYIKDEIVPGEGYELKRLGDICELHNGFAFKSSEYLTKGVPLLTIKHIPNLDLTNCKFIKNNSKFNKNVVKMNDILIALTGNTIGKFVLYNKNDYIYCNQRIGTLRLNEGSPEFIYYLLLSIELQKIILNIASASAQPNISIKTIENFNIPIPKSPEKIQYWVDKINAPFNEKNEKQTLLENLEREVLDRVKFISENEECDDTELQNIATINPENIKNDKLSFINYIDVKSVKSGKINNIQYLTKEYPSRAIRLVKRNDILYSTVRPNLKGYTILNYDIENSIASSGFAVIRSNKINPYYLYLLLKDDKINRYLIERCSGSQYPAVNPKEFKNIKLSIPKNKKLITELEPKFVQIEQLKLDIQEAETRFEQYIEELGNEAIKK